MNSVAPQITILALLASFLLLSIPIFAFARLRLPLIRGTVVAVLRMSGQLLLVGFFLHYLFDLDHPAITLAWVLLMILFAAGSVVRNCELPLSKFLPPTAFSMLTVTLFLLWYFLVIVMSRPHMLEIRYAVAIGGMLLGNSLRGNIIGVGGLRDNLQDNYDLYYYRLALGASQMEALKPFLQRAVAAAAKPTLAGMTTMGIVFLPGMMTGQILANESPLAAVRYQIAIMLAIYVCTIAGVALNLLFIVRGNFDAGGLPDEDFLKITPEPTTKS